MMLLCDWEWGRRDIEIISLTFGYAELKVQVSSFKER